MNANQKDTSITIATVLTVVRGLMAPRSLGRRPHSSRWRAAAAQEHDVLVSAGLGVVLCLLVAGVAGIVGYVVGGGWILLLLGVVLLLGGLVVGVLSRLDGPHGRTLVRGERRVR